MEVVVRLDAGDRTEGGLASLPDEQPLGLVRGETDLAGTVGATDLTDALHARLDRRGQPVELDDEDGRGVGREAGVDIGLDGARDGSVHHLERGGHETGGDDGADRRRAVLDPLEVQEQRAHDRRVLREADADAGGDAEHPLASDEHAAQVEPGRLGVLAAQDGDAPVRQHDLDGQDVHGRDTLGQAVRSAGVGGDVPAHRAALLAGGIRRVVHAVGGQEPAQIGVQHAGLHPRLPRVEIDGEDAVHLRRHDHERAVERDGSSGQAGARAAGDEGDAVTPSGEHARLDVLRRGGEGDDGASPFDVRTVAPVEVQLGGARAHAVATERGPQLVDQRRRRHLGGHVSEPTALWCTDGQAGGARGPPRVVVLRGSRGGQDVDLRRHVPELVVVLHLRPRLPGRPDGAGGAPRAGVLQLRRPLHRRRGHRRGHRCRRRA